MSALGQKRTNHRGPKFGFVRYCPKAANTGAIELSAMCQERTFVIIRTKKKYRLEGGLSEI